MTTPRFKVGDHVRCRLGDLTIVAVGPQSYLYAPDHAPHFDFRMTQTWADENCVLLPPPPKIADELVIWATDESGWLYVGLEPTCHSRHVGNVISYDNGTVEFKAAKA